MKDKTIVIAELADKAKKAMTVLIMDRANEELKVEQIETSLKEM